MTEGRPPPGDFDSLIQPLELTAAGRPKLLPDEIEIVTRDEATLYACRGRDSDARLSNGTATLTSHRVLWFGEAGTSRVNACIHLWDLREAKPNPGGRLKKSSKLQLFLSGQPAGAEPAVLLAVKGRDDFLDRMQSALSRRAWVKETAAEVVGKRAAEEAGGGSAGGMASGAGIAGILRRQELNRRAATDIATEAFSDLNSLIDQAKEVVAVIERYSIAVRDKQRAAAAAGGGADTQQQQQRRETDDLNNLLLDIGIASPVTKSSSGTDYHQQLARQLSDFLTSSPGPRSGSSSRSSSTVARPGLLERFGGVITLPDVFCLFNRARGTALVSPLDLLTAAELLQPLGLGMSLRRFRSGVAVVQADSHSDTAIGERLGRMAEERGSLLASEAARDLPAALTLATEHLRTAEELGVLCRDESIEGVRFYPNRFARLAQELAEANAVAAAGGGDKAGSS